MSKTWRRILTLKALALSMVLLGALVATAVMRRREPGAGLLEPGAMTSPGGIRA